MSEIVSAALQSRIYCGKVRHRRFQTRPHQFSYNIFMLYVDIDHIQDVTDQSWCWSLNKPNLAALYEKDYLPAYAGTLREKVNAVLREAGVRQAADKVYLLSHWRYFNYAINPISCFYCYNQSGRLETLILEVTNTPWKERKVYVLPCDPEAPVQQIVFNKELHVSPFFGMDMHYALRCNQPGVRHAFHLESYDSDGKAFDATLSLREKNLDSVNLLGMLLAYPFITGSVFLGIYWQAFMLWLKKVPFHRHPGKKEEKGAI